MNKVIQNDMDRLVKKCPYKDELKDKTILITGATGLIALNLSYFLLELSRQEKTNTKVVALVRNMDKAKSFFKDYLDDENLIFLNQDVCDPIKYDGKVDYIFHAAGNASAAAIKANPVGIIEANTIGTMNVLRFARDNNVTKVIFPSTREIYGKVDGVDSITESTMGVIDPMNSRNCYPESKRLSEALFVSYAEQYGVNFDIVRIAHTYGPGMAIMNDGRVMADFIGAIVNNQNIVLNSDGTAIRGFCYVTDTVEGIMHVLCRGNKNEAYNLANETDHHMIREVADMLVNIYPEKGLKVEFTNPTDEIKKGYVGYKIVKLDTSKIEGLGWEPEIKLLDGMKNTVDYFEEEEAIKLVRKK